LQWKIMCNPIGMIQMHSNFVTHNLEVQLFSSLSLSYCLDTIIFISFCFYAVQLSPGGAVLPAVVLFSLKRNTSDTCIVFLVKLLSFLFLYKILVSFSYLLLPSVCCQYFTLKYLISIRSHYWTKLSSSISIG
jgi:hypothetical protein